MDPHSDISRLIVAREIREVLHFTTNLGLLGVMATGKAMCRDRLPRESHIEYIYTPNCPDRLKDAAWTGYVNLSISRVNKRMLNSSNGWHPEDDIWWAVLSFKSEILEHEGVFFTTTNNTYDATVKRGDGAEGLANLFAPSVSWGHYGTIITRSPTLPSNFTTDPQAEVLYPDAVDLAYLQAIYVSDEDHCDWVQSLLEMLPSAPDVPVMFRPEVFQ